MKNIVLSIALLSMILMRVTVEAYIIKLITPYDQKTIFCKDDQYILDAAEEQGLELPYSSRTGACFTSASFLISGIVDNSDQTSLSREQMDKGFINLDTSIPRSDCTILTHQEDVLFMPELEASTLAMRGEQYYKVIYPDDLHLRFLQSPPVPPRQNLEKNKTREKGARPKFQRPESPAQVNNLSENTPTLQEEQNPQTS